MKGKKNSILSLLIRRYENSVLSTTGSERNLRIVCNLEKDFPEYCNYENFDLAQHMNDDIAEWEEKGWITSYYDDDEERYTLIQLNTDAVDEICEALHISTSKMTAKRMSDLLEKYRGQGIDPYIDDVLERIRTFRTYKSVVYADLQLQEDLLKSLAAMMKLEEDILERLFSAKILGNSKAFEKIVPKAVSILRRYFGCEEEDDQQLLAQYHILKNPGHLILKGHGTIQTGSSILHIGDFVEGLTLSSADVSHARILSIEDSSILTIENLTSFYQCGLNDTLIIYLGGYHNTVRRDFLMRLFAECPDKNYLHSGDIDAGGFQILEHLKSKTGIPFRPYRMDTETLMKHRSHAVSLTGNDRTRLLNLISIPEYKEVISCMLENNIKLEQEQIDYSAEKPKE